MVTALSDLEPHFWCQLRLASARPILVLSCLCAREMVYVYVELVNGLSLASIPPSGLLKLAWRRLDSFVVDLGAGWPHTVRQRCSGRASSNAASVCPVVSGVKIGTAAYTNDTVPSLR